MRGNLIKFLCVFLLHYTYRPGSIVEVISLVFSQVVVILVAYVLLHERILNVS